MTDREHRELIERCARIADMYADRAANGSRLTGFKIARAIRDLKQEGDQHGKSKTPNAA